MLNDKSLNSAWVAGLVWALISFSGAQEANTLSSAETEAGYDPLFNGKDLNNWHAYRSDKVTDAWRVKTDAPLGPRIENVAGEKRSIMTDNKYQNFDIKIDVKVTRDGNSGIFTRYEETALTEKDARSGPEFQVCGPENNDCSLEKRHFGSVYDLFGVSSSIRDTWYNAHGQWNQIRIVAFDSNYAHYGNGKKLLEYKIGTAEFIKAFNASKYANDVNNRRYYHIHPGAIMLQHHGEHGMAFRNLKAKELTVHPFLKEFPDGKWPEELPQDFVFGPPTTSLGSGMELVPSQITARHRGSGAIMVSVPLGHIDFQVTDVHGRQVPFIEMGEGRYSLSRHEGKFGIVVIRAILGNQSLSTIINLY